VERDHVVAIRSGPGHWAVRRAGAGPDRPDRWADTGRSLDKTSPAGKQPVSSTTVV
jgi:hypothetical protein